ncbi:MAG: hypothetical protein O6761_01580 [Thaumarchaeota archaeon]|nr:hypothetical protein [Nitrososphaerota archaeon]
MSKKRAISTVLTTMIILVASVVLGTGVVTYGTSLFQTGAQQQAITTQGVTMWVNSTDNSGIAWGAAGVRNSGDKIVSVDNIQVRGQTIGFSSWYVDKDQTRVTVDNFQSQFVNNGTNTGGDAHELFDSIDSGGSVTTSCTVGTDDTVIELDFDGSAPTKPTICLLQASGPTTLLPGERMIVYFHLPDGILSTTDAGASTSVSVYAGQTGAPVSVTVANP